MPNTAYDQFKEHEGKRYTGMKIGRGHKWKYEAGDWAEKKVTPDKWEFQYSVVKRRKGRAPEGSGAPLGTAYNWYILAHQVVTKLDANSYTTEMAGMKYKLAHKRADKTTWSASDRAQRKRLVQILREMIYELAHRTAATATDLRGELGLDAGYVSRILQRFEKRGWIQRDTSKEDGRRHLLSLTRSGRTAFEPLDARSNDEVRRLVGAIAP